MDIFSELTQSINHSSNTLKTPIQSPQKTLNMSTILTKNELNELISKLNNFKKKKSTLKKKVL